MWEVWLLCQRYHQLHSPWSVHDWWHQGNMALAETFFMVHQERLFLALSLTFWSHAHYPCHKSIEKPRGRFGGTAEDCHILTLESCMPYAKHFFHWADVWVNALIPLQFYSQYLHWPIHAPQRASPPPHPHCHHLHSQAMNSLFHASHFWWHLKSQWRVMSLRIPSDFHMRCSHLHSQHGLSLSHSRVPATLFLLLWRWTLFFVLFSLSIFLNI